MKYKGIEGHFHYNKDMKMLVGELVGTMYLVTFTGSSINDIKVKFRRAVNDYLNMLNKKG